MTSRTTVLAVVLGLALLGAVAMGGAILLSHQALDKATIDPAAVGLIAGLTGLAGTCIGALAGVLASTRSTLGPNDTEPSTFQATVTTSSLPAAAAPAPTATGFVTPT